MGEKPKNITVFRKFDIIHFLPRQEKVSENNTLKRKLEKSICFENSVYI